MAHIDLDYELGVEVSVWRGVIRFMNCVADESILWLSVSDARCIAKVLREAADEIEASPDERPENTEHSESGQGMA